MSKIWKLWGNLTKSARASERELYGLQYIGGVICHTSATQKKIQKLKVQQIYLFWLRSFRSTHKCKNQKTNSTLPRGGLWFISEILQKILAIAAMCFSGEKNKTWNL